MNYLLSFLEGIITFVSPCLLPMLPVYISYFTAGGEDSSRKKTLQNALGFVLGFGAVFVTMGALAGVLGSFLSGNKALLNIICGAVVVLLGLSFLDIIRLPWRGGASGKRPSGGGFFKTMLLGAVFSVGWTPCVGAFLGSALMLAASSGSGVTGILMLLLFSLGLGIPFIISALLIDSLKGAFDFIKRHYKAINAVSGVILIAAGVLMMTGLFDYFYRWAGNL